MLAAVGVTVAGIVEIYRKKVLYADGGSHTQVDSEFYLSSLFIMLLIVETSYFFRLENRSKLSLFFFINNV